MTPFSLDHPAVQAYLARLDAAIAHVPPDERSDISEGIRSHLDAALADAHTEADVRRTLDALGDPEEIAGAASPATPAPPPRPPAAPAPPVPRSARGALEVIAVIFLLVGAFIVPVIGWFVGVVLLWVSKAWTTGEKVLGTLVVPGGLGVAPLLAVFMPVMGRTCGVTVDVASDGVSAAPGGGMVESCTGGLPLVIGIALALLVVVGPIVVAVYLLRVAGRRPAPPA